MLPLLCLAPAVLASDQLQINYYTDYSCSDYLGQVGVSWASFMGSGDTNCFNYHYGASANIASCSEETCTCFFYYDQNCAGDYSTVYGKASGADDCIKNAAAYNSFRCYYFNSS